MINNALTVSVRYFFDAPKKVFVLKYTLNVI